MGGPEKVARQHELGKLTIRERVGAIVDGGSFREIGALAGVGEYDDDGNLTGFTPSNFVFGTAEEAVSLGTAGGRGAAAGPGPALVPALRAGRVSAPS